MSGRVGGTFTWSASGSWGDSVVGIDMRSSRVLTSGAERVRPVQELTYEACASMGREERSGVITVRPSG